MNESMCAHEIKAYGWFCLQFFEKRHIRRDRVVGSLNGWCPSLTDPIDSIIGNIEEERVDALHDANDLFDNCNV